MPRNIDPLTLAGYKGRHVWETFHVWLDYPSSAVYANNSTMDFTWDPGSGPQVFEGVGQFGGISQLEELSERQSARVTLTLSGLDPDLLSKHLAADYMNRRGLVWQATHNDDWTLRGQPRGWFGGRISDQRVSWGTRATITVTLSSVEEAWREKPGGSYNDLDQQSRYLGDLGQANKHLTAEGREMQWGRA